MLPVVVMRILLRGVAKAGEMLASLLKWRYMNLPFPFSVKDR